MYEGFYNLRERPFELGSNLRFLFLPEAHREALSNLQYGIASRKGVTVLTGEVGTGKTTLVRAAIARTDSSTVCVHLPNPRLTRNEFFQMLAHGFGLGLKAAASKVECLAALEDSLVSRLDRGEHSTLIVDEAQSVSDELLEEIRLLTNIERLGGRLLPIILVGQPEFGDRLNEPALRHLKQRIALRCSLRALTLHETAGYIATRITVAGGNAATVFTREAVQLINEVSGGIPRVISVLCDNALVTGFAANQRPVGSRLVQEVCKDFQIACREQIPEEVAVALPHAPQDEGAGIVSPGARPNGPLAPENSVVDEPTRPANPLFGSFGRPRRFGIF
jgi:general secretion pathway protein A